MNLVALATALAQVGVVTGMELDIHSGMQSFSTWRSDPSGVLRAEPLLPTMSGPPDRFVRPDSRDFFYFTTVNAPTAQAN